jgi:thymidylate kinase
MRTEAVPSGPRRRPLLISFSGLDGSGKSTQIAALTELLQSWGYRVCRLAFWDDVVVLTRYREGFVHKVFHSEQGVGAPGKPVTRRDKNMRGWHLSLARHFLYFLDACHLRRVIARQRRNPCDALILDRYIYDELANLPLLSPISRSFVRWMSRLAPRPDVAFLLDADPELAQARKPEYPVAFMRECRGWYHQLAVLLGTLTVIPPLPLSEAQREIAQALRRVLAAHADGGIALPWRKSA